MSKEPLGSFQFKIQDIVSNADGVVPEELIVYRIKKDTVVYPQSTGRGVATNDFYADKLQDIKIRGYSGFKTRESVTLFLDGRYWNLSEGSRIGVPSSRAKKVKIPLK